MENERWKWCLMLHFSDILSLWGTELFFNRIRHDAILGGPSAPRRWRRLIPTYPFQLRDFFFRPAAGWKDKVDDLVATLEALGPDGCEQIKWKMMVTVDPNEYQKPLYHPLPKDIMDDLRSMAFGW
jgi:hypothetical protein